MHPDLTVGMKVRLKLNRNAHGGCGINNLDDRIGTITKIGTEGFKYYVEFKLEKVCKIHNFRRDELSIVGGYYDFEF